MPIRPDFTGYDAINPCILDSTLPGGCTQLPAVHVLSGWHMLTDDVKSYFDAAPYASRIEINPNHACFGLWKTSKDAMR